MNINEIESLIVNNSALERIKTDYKGVNPIMVVTLTNNKEIRFNLSKGYWGTRTPRIENETLVLPSPKDENPSKEITTSQVVTIYKQSEYYIPIENIYSVKYEYERPTYSEIQNNTENV